MPQGPEHAPKTDEEVVEAARLAGWDPNDGPAPYAHGLPVDGLETSTSPPANVSAS